MSPVQFRCRVSASCVLDGRKIPDPLVCDFSSFSQLIITRPTPAWNHPLSAPARTLFCPAVPTNHFFFVCIRVDTLPGAHEDYQGSD